MKYSVVLLLLAFSFSTFAQNDKKKGGTPEANTSAQTASPDLFSSQMSVYKNALSYYDLSTATVALYNAIALKPERKDLYDSLTYLYFAGERYGQVYLLAEKLLKEDEKRTDIREMLAVAKQSLNMPKEALAEYEKLYATTKNIHSLYQMATLQYQLKRFGECIVSLDQIIANPEAEKTQIAIKNQDGGGQNVPMKAAALNIKGICAMEMNQEEIAKENFNEAIKIFPEFILAKNNLQFLAQRKAQQGAATQPQKTTTPAAPKK
ncbi:MAG: hypothetical protein M9931_01910 [Chitinophagales bacterium]|nr:hypothetical protein [Chitinophagales bacterium]